MKPLSSTGSLLPRIASSAGTDARAIGPTCVVTESPRIVSSARACPRLRNGAPRALGDRSLQLEPFATTRSASGAQYRGIDIAQALEKTKVLLEAQGLSSAPSQGGRVGGAREPAGGGGKGG